MAALVLPGVSLAAVDESMTLATIRTMTPMVRVKLNATAQPQAATLGMSLPEGAQVITLPGGSCEIAFSRAHIVRLFPSSTITVQRLQKKSAMRILVQLLGGRARAIVDRMRADGDFGMYAATTITAVKGTDYEMSRSPTGEVEVAVNEGKVDTAEMKSEDLAEVEKAFTLVLLGQIGMKLIEGNRVRTMPGQHLGAPERMPRPSRFDAAPREHPAHGKGATDATPKGGKTPPPGGKGGKGGKGGGTGGAGGAGMPSLPGVGGFGLP
jgi:hypothetical protein